ncbi:MAG: hypothetical protein GY820_17635 [Gammaproteobacteria bacterium]|nr:hypothetical protein [Gammaproteobacteria bacterium]
MIEAIVKQWDANKHKLEEYFATTKQEDYSDYKTIVVKLFELVITEIENEWSGTDKFDISKMTVIDDGDYQGTTIYIIPKDTYQPSISDYVITDNYYGSCSGCDTLLAISEYSDDLPSKEQVKEYMTIALHLVQKLRWLGSDE